MIYKGAPTKDGRKYEFRFRYKDIYDKTIFDYKILYTLNILI